MRTRNAGLISSGRAFQNIAGAATRSCGTTPRLSLAWLIFMVIGTVEVGAEIQGTTEVHADMRGSPHDFSLDGEGICLYCHSSVLPSSGASLPLANMKMSNQSFTMYSSPTIDMIAESILGEASLVCLSCHDGTVAFSPRVKTPGVNDGGVMARRAAIGADGMMNDHPISIEYDPFKDPDFAPVTDGKVAGLPLYAKPDGSGRRTQTECLTCHDPHHSNNGYFLRVSNERSQLCLTCHLK